jgi:hypothetical protein
VKLNNGIYRLAEKKERESESLRPSGCLAACCSYTLRLDSEWACLRESKSAETEGGEARGAGGSRRRRRRIMVVTVGWLGGGV